MTLDVSIVLQIATLIVTVGSAVGVIIKVLKKFLKGITTDILRSELSSYQSSINEKLEDMNDKLCKFIEHQESSNETMKDSLLASTRDRINQAHDYYMRKGFIGAHSLYVIEELYSTYTKLGGNSFISHQMEDIRGLEVRSAETILKSGSSK